MIVDAFTIIRTKDKITFQIDNAWLDKWPMINVFGQPAKLPPNCNVLVTQDNIEFMRKIDNHTAADVCEKDSS
jgi:hypothetical protein